MSGSAVDVLCINGRKGQIEKIVEASKEVYQAVITV